MITTSLGWVIDDTQTILFFLAYRMDVHVYGSSQTRLAPGCKGSVGDGSCYFDEFVKHVSPKWHDSTSVGTDLEPDVEAASQDLRKTDYNGHIDQEVLFAHEPWASRSQPAPFPPMIEAIGNNIQACRQQAGADPKVATLLDKSREAIAMVHFGRLADQEDRVIDGVNQMLSDELTKANKPVFVRKYCASAQNSRLRSICPQLTYLL